MKIRRAAAMAIIICLSLYSIWSCEKRSRYTSNGYSLMIRNLGSRNAPQHGNADQPAKCSPFFQKMLNSCVIPLPPMKLPLRLFCQSAASLLFVFSLPACNREAKAARKLATAKAYFEKANYAAAEIEFKNVLKLDPGDAQAMRGLGLIWMSQGAMLEACRILSAAKQKLPKDNGVGVKLAQALFELGFIGDSRKTLLETLEQSPSDGESLMLLAEISFTPEAMTECEERLALAKSPNSAPVVLASALIDLRRGQLDAGAKLVDRALEIDPTFARAHALQGNLFNLRKQPEKAIGPMQKAADLAGPRSAELGLHAKLLMELGRKDEAVALLKKATEAAPDYLPNWRMLSQISVASNNDGEASGYLAKVLAKSPLDIEAAILQSQIWLRQNESSKALELLEELTTTFPSRPQLDVVLAKAYLVARDFRKATDTLDRILTHAPETTDAILLRTSLFLKDAQVGEALRRLEPLIAAQPTNLVAQELLVKAYLAANRSDDAVATLKKLSLESPNNPNLPLQLGQILASQKKSNEARTAFERVLQLSPDHLGAIAQWCALDQLDGMSDAAMARADAYLAAHPESSDAHYLKASLCYAQNDFKSSEAFLNKTIELKPDHFQAYGMLVRLQINAGRSDEAIVHIKELLKSSPQHIAARMQLGTLLQNLGRMDEARTTFEELVKIAPNFAPAYNNLACIASEIAHVSKNPEILDKAVENARKARSLAPQVPTIADTLGWIEWLRGKYSDAMPLLLEAAQGLPASAQVQYHLAMTHYMRHQIPEARATLEKALAMPNGLSDSEKSDAQRRLSILADGQKWDLAAIDQQVKQNPKDVVLIMALAQKLATAGRPQDALAAYQSALAINSEIEAAHLGEAEIYAYALNQPDKALVSANLARKLAPQCPQAAAILGAIHFRLANHPQAYALLQEAASKLPEVAAVQADYAWAAYSMGHVEIARSTMATVAEIEPTRAQEAREFLSLTAPNAAADPALSALMETRLTSKPNDVPALMVRAARQEKSGENPALTYGKVLEVFPQHNPARIALARVLLDDPAQLEVAENLANAARDQHNDGPELSAILATVNFRKGKFDYAAQLFKELSAKRPLTGPELCSLGLSQAATKRPDEARQSLTQALQSTLPDADATKAKAALAELEKPRSKE